jgi:quinol monooxygenase YgiN
MNDENYSVEIIRYNIPADKHESFESSYLEAGKYLKTSKYCLSYQVLHGNEEPNNYIIIIHWTSQDEHLNGFRKSAEFGPFFNLVRPFFHNIQEMKHYDLISNSWRRDRG